MDQHIWNEKIDLRPLVPEGMRDRLLGNWTLSGDSRGGLRTGFKMNKFYLDAGHTVFSDWNVLLVSHGHADHVFSVGAFFLLPDLQGTYVFAPYVKRLIDYAQGLLKLDGNTNMCRYLPTLFHDTLENISKTVVIDDHQYLVKTRQLCHRIPATGYFISQYTNRLNPLLLTIKESLANAKKFGDLMRRINKGETYENITRDTMYEKVLLEQFCYLTDTSIKGISDNIDLIQHYPIIIVECTFYDKDHVDKANQKTHIHWTQIEPYIRKYKDSLWVLIHNSTRHRNMDEIKDAIGTNYQDAVPLPENCFFSLELRDMHNHALKDLCKRIQVQEKEIDPDLRDSTSFCPMSIEDYHKYRDMVNKLIKGVLTEKMMI